MNDRLIFAKEKKIEHHVSSSPWKVLIADDEMEVHVVTRMVLSDFSFEDRRLEFISAYSGLETKKIMRENPDIAVVLLDVVMEEEVSGLEVARYIREELENSFVRIILRTGQPGRAPERKVIKEFDINDYKEKTELTTQKLFTSITSSLRSYRDLVLIDKNRHALEFIIEVSSGLFELKSLDKFSQDVLYGLVEVVSFDEDHPAEKIQGLILVENAKHLGSDQATDQQNSIANFKIMAGLGEIARAVGSSAASQLDPVVTARLTRVLSEKKLIFENNYFLGYFYSRSNIRSLIYLESAVELSKSHINHIKLFANSIGVAIDNIFLNIEVEETQKEVIFTLGSLVESRSKETSNHVLRVADYSYILAKKAGLSEEEAAVLRLASPMHDVGKLGIPDAIINKPGKLTEQEFELIKTHTIIGYDILKGSKRRILETAAMITLQHHERWDGLGYPYGLRGEEIHIYGRITGLADVFDALTHKRVYKEGWDYQAVQTYLKEEQGKQFDPQLIDIILNNFAEFVAVKNEYPD